MGLRDFHNHRKQFNRLNYRLKTLLLGLAALLIVISIILAIIIFIYVFNIATHPLSAKELVDQWSAIFLEASVPSSGVSPFNGPARWFAVITLIVLSYLLIRIPLLMLQMGTQLLISCQEDNRPLRNFVRQVLQDLRHEQELSHGQEFQQDVDDAPPLENK